MSINDQPAGDDGVSPMGKPTKPAKTWRTARERMDPAQAVRQGEAARRAFAVLGDRDTALRFLNDDHSELGGRPIDLAIASVSGLESVLCYLASAPVGYGSERVHQRAAATHAPFSPTD